MKLYFSLSKKVLAALTASFCLCIFIWGRFAAAKNIYKNGNTHAKRVYFLDALGYEIDEESAVNKEIEITAKTAERYGIKGYIGCDSYLYCYNTKDGNEQIDLVIYNGRVIGVKVAPLY